MGDTHLTELVLMYPGGEFKKNLIKPSNRAEVASNVEGNGHESGVFCFSTCGCCELGAAVQPCSPSSLWL